MISLYLPLGSVEDLIAKSVHNLVGLVHCKLIALFLVAGPLPAQPSETYTEIFEIKKITQSSSKL